MDRINFLITGILLIIFSSCDYREYPDADYPDNRIYQPMALEKVWTIDKENVEESMMTSGGNVNYVLDKANNKFIIPMGVVQSGIVLKSIEVNVSVDNTVINEMISMNELSKDVVILPESEYTFPTTVNLNKEQAAGFNFEIKLDALIGENLGKKFVVAVKIESPSVQVTEGLDIVVICINTSFLKDLTP